MSKDLRGAELKKGRYAILEPEKLAELLEQVVATEYGSQLKAAQAITPGGSTGGIPLQRQISRLIAGRIGAISDRTMTYLLRLIPQDRHDELWDVFLTPSARLRLDWHGRWMRRRLDDTDLGQPTSTRMLESKLRSRVPDLFTGFERFLIRRGYQKGCVRSARADVAFRELLMPLQRDLATAGIERGFEELSEWELRKYVKHSLAAQRVLLDRPYDTVRARQLDQPI